MVLILLVLILLVLILLVLILLVLILLVLILLELLLLELLLLELLLLELLLLRTTTSGATTSGATTSGATTSGTTTSGAATSGATTSGTTTSGTTTSGTTTSGATNTDTSTTTTTDIFNNPFKKDCERDSPTYECKQYDWALRNERLKNSLKLDSSLTEEERNEKISYTCLGGPAGEGNFNYTLPYMKNGTNVNRTCPYTSYDNGKCIYFKEVSHANNCEVYKVFTDEREANQEVILPERSTECIGDKPIFDTTTKQCRARRQSDCDGTDKPIFDTTTKECRARRQSDCDGTDKPILDIPTKQCRARIQGDCDEPDKPILDLGECRARMQSDCDGTDKPIFNNSTKLCEAAPEQPAGTYKDSFGGFTPWSNCSPGQFMVSDGNADSNRICQDCPVGTYSTEENASSCTDCASGTYQDQTGKTECIKHTSCGNKPIQTQGSASLDQTCGDECGVGKYFDGADCQDILNCTAGQYASTQPDATTNRVCSPCPDNTFSTSETANNSSCTTWNNCANDQYSDPQFPPNSTRNRVCKTKNTCSKGQYITGTNETGNTCANFKVGDGKESCNRKGGKWIGPEDWNSGNWKTPQGAGYQSWRYCQTSYELNADNVKEQNPISFTWSKQKRRICGLDPPIECIDPTSKDEIKSWNEKESKWEWIPTRCGLGRYKTGSLDFDINNVYNDSGDLTWKIGEQCTQNVCTCENGTATLSKNCPSNGKNHCESCNNGYSLRGNQCVKDVCTCANGVAATGNKCPSGGGEKCVMCGAGYTLKNGKCVQNVCTCANGVAATGAACT